MQVGTCVASLTQGMQVRISSGTLAGNVYEYIGDASTDSDPEELGNQEFDLSLQDYGDDSLWAPVDVVTSESLGGALVDALTPGMKVRITRGSLMDDIYEYVGPSLTDSDPDADGNQQFDLSVQQYRDASLWKQANIAENAAQVRAYIEDSAARAAGALTIDANSDASIDATVVAAALGVGGGGTTGVAVSGAGSYSEDRIKTDVKAYIDGDTPSPATTEGIEAFSIALVADDSSTINAVAGAGSLAAGFGSSAGVAVAVGLSLAFNEVSNDVEAYIANADQGVTASGGSITISAVSGGQHLFELTVGGQLTPGNLDDAATADMDDPDDPANEPILVTPDDPDTPEDESEYTGGDDVKSRFDDDANGTLSSPLNEAVVDADADRLALQALRDAFALWDEELAMYDTVATAAQYRTSDGDPDVDDGKLDVREGTTVLLEKGYMAGAEGDYDGSKGTEGRVYRYIVMASETDDSENLIDLSTENYTDTTKWQLVDKLKVSILVEGKKWVVVAPDGKAYVLELNATGDKIGVSRETINAVSAAASLAVGIGGSAGIAVSGAGAVSQNVILTKVNAYGEGSVLDSADDLALNATSTSTISSAVIAASLGIGGGGAAGVVLPSALPSLVTSSAGHRTARKVRLRSGLTCRTPAWKQTEILH